MVSEAKEQREESVRERVWVWLMCWSPRDDATGQDRTDKQKAHDFWRV